MSALAGFRWMIRPVDRQLLRNEKLIAAVPDGHALFGRIGRCSLADLAACR